MVEDNELNRIVVCGFLSRLKLKVEMAENGKIAVDMFKASEPGYYDAILMDVQMPEMDGYEATKIIRKCGHPEASNIQIIAQTADAFNEDIAKAFSAGMNDHISKPINLNMLAKALQKAFDLKTQGK